MIEKLIFNKTAQYAEMMRQAGAGAKTSSPKDQILIGQRERLRAAFPGKIS